MPSPVERTPQERETLIFPTPQEGEAWRQEVGEALRQTQTDGMPRQKEALAAAVAKQFEKAGEGVSVIRHPWEHTPAEHAEAQQLVDVAFAKDLPAAIKQARSSPHYPRNLDLFHDVLTNELYEVLRQQGLDRQSVVPPLLGMAIAVCVGLLVVALIFIWGLS